MGEVVLRDYFARKGISDVSVTSAGVSAEEQGNRIDSRAQKVLRDNDYDVPVNHYAHRATAEELKEADLILAMTVGHARSLRSMLESVGGDTRKVHLWREFDGTTPISSEGVFGADGVLGPNREAFGSGAGAGKKRSQYSDFYSSDGNYDVPDPWYGPASGFADTLETVEAGAAGIVEWVAAQEF